MYIIDFFKRLTSKNNIPIMIYFIMNVFLIGYIMSLFFKNNYVIGFLTGIVLYTISLAIALSPFGEWILRKETGCKKLVYNQDTQKLKDIFDEVYKKAKKECSDIPNNVRLYICKEKAPNAFATGRKTICITEGLLSMKDEQIKAILGHEFGHLAHKDTDFILLVSVGNLIITTIVIIFKIISFLACTLVDACLEESGFGTFFHILFTASVSIFMWIWTKIGVLLVMKSSRENEYEADDFSLRIGFGKELCEGLDAISVNDNKIKGLFANLVSSHPNTKDRIARLQSNGAEYNKKLA